MSDDLTTIDAFQLSRDRARRRVSLVIYHRDGAEIVQLFDEIPIVVGRRAPADVALADPSLSRQHARFWRSGEQVWVEDLGSTNGTLVNGERVARVRLRETDEIQIGAISVALQVLTTQDPELVGVESHDRLVDALDSEIVRARTFGRPIALMMVRTPERQRTKLASWAPRVRQLLREVDRVALYSTDALLIMLPESTVASAVELAERIIASRGDDPRLLAGVAGYPQQATSAGALVDAVREAARAARARQPIKLAASPTGGELADDNDEALAASPQMRALLATIDRIAPSQIPVLITGETGTGKEVAARALHERSRQRRALRCINCGAIPKDLIEASLFGHERGAFTGANEQRKGLFEEADGGSVLLDEIGELSGAAQAALLRVLETKRVTRVGSTTEREVDVRIIAATHRDLDAMCSRGEFRADLFYRLNTMTLEVPPLRDRRADILPLAERFVALANERNSCHVSGIDPAAQRLLEGYKWPGNVRELKNVIERAVVIAAGATITAADLSDRVRRQGGEPTADLKDSPQAALDIKGKVRRYEAELLTEALEQHGWNQTETAQALGMPLRTLVHKIKALNLKR